MHKVFLADIIESKIDEYESKMRMLELENLVWTFWWFVIMQKIQKKQKPDYTSYVWKWKLDEIVQEMLAKESDLLILWNILKPRQLFHINEKLREASEKHNLPYKMEAWDRVDLILKIFGKHAVTEEAKLQIELVAIKHMGPRIFKMWLELSRQWWWIGTSGIWETNTERMKRHLKEKRRVIERKLQEYEKMRFASRERRKKQNLISFGIVWYTNAGKSSLMNAITSKDVLAENKLFATLGTISARTFIWYEDSWKPIEVLMHDTIWFIRNLPPQLIKAFRSTLEDSIFTDVLLHVVDCADAEVENKIRIVDEILEDIGAKQPKIYVFNKSDKLTKIQKKEISDRFGYLNPIFVSSIEKLGLDELRGRMLENVR